MDRKISKINSYRIPKVGLHDNLLTNHFGYSVAKISDGVARDAKAPKYNHLVVSHSSENDDS